MEVTVTKLVGTGQSLGELASGKKVFVWNALPGEKVRIRVIREKHSFAEAIAEEIIDASPERIVPRDTHFLATSPWQIMKFEAENGYKKDITEELFRGLKIVLPAIIGTTHDEREWQYRNKMEYSFWGDEAGLHLALHQRGSHSKQIVAGSGLAMPAVDRGAGMVLLLLQAMKVRAGDLKTIIVRSSQREEVTVSLFVKTESFPALDLPEGIQGLRVYYSNPKSPASVLTKLLYERGESILRDDLLEKTFLYDTDSFFQVNVPMFEQVLARIKAQCRVHDLVEMYAGVGSIGLSVAGHRVDLIDLDPATVRMARINAASSGLEVKVIETSSEKALEFIDGSKPLIVDPPRAGLHDKVTARILEVMPPQVVYLSCNPVTQARDLLKLQEKYTIGYFEIFNFFPRTPHIETLAILQERRS